MTPAGETMQAFRLVEWQQPPELVRVAVPVAGPGEVLVRVAGNGLCHSDITMMGMTREIGEAIGWNLPFTLGHEAAGWVAALGDGVSGVAVGDAVALMSANSCGRCRYCRIGRDSLCADNMVGRGYGRDGGLAEYVVADATRDLVPLGDLDPTTAGTLTDAGATSYHAVSRVLARLQGLADPTGRRPSVAVFGIGGLGVFAVQILAALADVEIIAVDRDAGRREHALSLGAHHSVDGIDRSTRRALRDIAGPDGVDGVIDIVGTDESIDCGIRSLARGGAFALVGAAGGTLARPWFPTLPHEAEVFTFQGSSRAHVEAVVGLAREGRVVVEAERFALSDVATAYERMEAGTLAARAVIVPGDGDPASTR
ncbi:MAG: alcohol dehydrogenase catalytic domain-containing protein [Acidimicrobiales bacterium]